MFVKCPTCENHYDDEAQQKKCMGIGRGVPVDPTEKGNDSLRTSHPFTGVKPVTEANADAKACAAGEGTRPR